MRIRRTFGSPRHGIDRRRRPGVLTLGGLLLFALLLFAGPAAAKERSEAHFLGFDALVTPGQTVTIRAKLVTDGLFHFHVHGQKVIFRLKAEGTIIGRATTADEGVASCSWKPPRAGKDEYDVEVSLPKGAATSAPPALLRVFVWKEKRPVLVVDVDGTISLGSVVSVLGGRIHEIPQRSGASKALRALAGSYAICYLTARDDSLIGSTRAWLDLEKFPHGPVLVRDTSLFNLSSEKYKAARLKRLGRNFHLVAGVGDQEDDADAYIAAGLNAYLIGPVERVPTGARKLVRWSEIERLLAP